jgi:cytochrome c biogenesis protein CcmG, thiol:disulfide interchange protein DsbE
MKRTFLTGIMIGLLAAITGCEEVAAGRVEVGQPAPEYGAVTLAGDSIHLAQLRGQVVLLNVWATWCPPCREEMPDLQELYDRHSHRGLEVVGVSVDARNEREGVRRFVDDFNLSFSIWHDPDDIVGGRFRVIGVPSTFLIGRDGVLLWRHVGPVTADDPTLNAALEEALAAEV